MFFGFSSTQIFLLLAGFVITMWAQMKVKSTFARYSQIRSRKGMTGAQVAKQIMYDNDIHDVQLEETKGLLSDHYDPVHKKLRLSGEIYHSTSVAAIGVAAHEVGHAIQHKRAYAPLNIRHGLFPIANIGSNLAMPLFIFGLFFQRGMGFLMYIGIFLFLGAVIFQLVTLPVEFNASSRALVQLETGGYLARDEIKSVRKVLSAAALTYVAAAAVAVMHLVRLLLIRGAMDD